MVTINRVNGPDSSRTTSSMFMCLVKWHFFEAACLVRRIMDWMLKFNATTTPRAWEVHLYHWYCFSNRKNEFYVVLDRWMWSAYFWDQFMESNLWVQCNGQYDSCTDMQVWCPDRGLCKISGDSVDVHSELTLFSDNGWDDLVRLIHVHLIVSTSCTADIVSQSRMSQSTPTRA